MKSLFTVTLIILAIATAVYAQAAEEAVWFDEDAPRFTAEQRIAITRLNAEFQARVEPVFRSDPRYPQYLAALEELQSTDDPRLFRERNDAFQTAYRDFQRGVLRLAGITERDYNLRLQQILPHLRLDAEGRIVNDHSDPRLTQSNRRRSGKFEKDSVFFLRASEETFEITDFSEKWSFKDCFQGKVEFPTSKSFNFYAKTDFFAEDCDDIKAARGTVINVPSGVDKVKIEIFLDEYLLRADAEAYAIFGYAHAYAAVGIRIKGMIAGSANPVNYFRHKYYDVSWSVLGGDVEYTVETDVRMVKTIIPTVPGEYTIQAYGRGTVDTDGFAGAYTGSDVKGLKKIRITFFR